MLHKDFVLWGTGKLANKYSKLLKKLGINIINYCDRDPSKWGTLYEGKKILSPKELKLFSKINILISCADVFAVKKDIYDLKLDGIEIYDIEKFYRKFFVENITPIECAVCNISRKKEIIIDNLEGTVGGAEDWAYNIGLELFKRGNKVSILECQGKYLVDVIRGEKINCFLKQPDFLEKYIFLKKYLIKIKPFILINIWSGELLLAAATVKHMYPNEVKIIFALLNDMEKNYEVASVWHDEIDNFFCISSLIANKLKKIQNLSVKKIAFRVPFIIKRIRKKRSYSNVDEKLKICYPSRIEQVQKRADVIPEILTMLNKKGIRYMMSIVGNGGYDLELKKEIANRKLQKNMIFFDWMTKEDLIEFLYTQDVYLNTSEYEGTSLTMLEAMASGCVPVVTKVSGVADFVKPNLNGFVCPVNDIKLLVDGLVELAKNRKMLADYGKSSMDIVFEKCGFGEYVTFLERMFDNL